jgi:serine/threonine protein kinase
MDERPYPQPFGEYLLLEQINAGGMAEIFKAKTFGVEGFERLVAIKRILPHLMKDESFVAMLADEAHIVVQLSNAHIAQVYELGAVDGQYYIAMEYVAGIDLKRTLRHLTQKGAQLPLPLVAYIGSCICNALDYAHGKCDVGGTHLGIVHRDISPHNVLIGYGGAVKVTDFGIAKAEHRRTQTQGHALKGKFSYMSPEQSHGRGLDHRSDIFSTGSVLWEMLTGKAAFTGADPFQILDRVRRGNVAVPSSVRDDVPDDLDRIVLRALAVDPEQRYPSAGELGDALERFSLSLDERPTGSLLADFMATQFADEIARENRSLRGFLGGPAPATEQRAPSSRPARATWHDGKTKVIATSSWRTPGATGTAAPAPEPTSPAIVEKRKAIVSILLAVGVLVIAVPLGTVLWRLADPVTEVAGEPTPAALNAAQPVEPPPAPGPSTANDTAEADVSPETVSSRTAATRPRGEERADPAARTGRADYLACRAELSGEMRSAGILSGDLARLDAQRAKMGILAKQSRFADATTACQRAVAVLARTEIDEDLVMKKLARFNEAFDQTGAQGTVEVASLAEAIAGAITAGDFRTANRLLNRGLAITRRMGARERASAPPSADEPALGRH